jgi:hypothetical protein
LEKDIYIHTSGILWVCMGIEWGYRDERGHKLGITYVYIYNMENSTKSHPQFIENQTTAGILLLGFLHHECKDDL